MTTANPKTALNKYSLFIHFVLVQYTCPPSSRANAAEESENWVSFGDIMMGDVIESGA